MAVGLSLLLGVALLDGIVPTGVAYMLGLVAAVLLVGGLEVGHVARCLDLLPTLSRAQPLQVAHRSAVRPVALREESSGNRPTHSLAPSLDASPAHQPKRLQWAA